MHWQMLNYFHSNCVHLNFKRFVGSLVQARGLLSTFSPSDEKSNIANCKNLSEQLFNQNHILNRVINFSKRKQHQQSFSKRSKQRESSKNYLNIRYCSSFNSDPLNSLDILNGKKDRYNGIQVNLREALECDPQISSDAFNKLLKGE